MRRVSATGKEAAVRGPDSRPFGKSVSVRGLYAA
jgi:hypothetical protein